MDDEPLLPPSLGDPLRRIDVRFEPYDPVFDADEEPQARIWPRKRRRLEAAKALAALGILVGCAEPPRARETSETVVVQLAQDVPTDDEADALDGADVAPDRSVDPDDPPGNREDDDADGSST